MSLRKQYILITAGTVILFCGLYFLNFFRDMETRLYDGFLHFRKDRPRLEQVVFLDVDDAAIAHIGVFPWPRSVVAKGLLRMKEFGVMSAIFDIEYIDKSPSGIDEVYMQQGLALDFSSAFSEINSSTNDLIQAVLSGQIARDDALMYAEELTGIIYNQKDVLLEKTKKLASDNDLLLAQAARLNGRTWGTLNLQQENPLEGEQAERKIYAAEHFSYPVKADPGVPGKKYRDILPPFRGFMEALEGAGFTNVEIDNDGVRRRIYLAQEFDRRWYLQLAMAPLINHLGNPDIILKKGRLVISGAKINDVPVKDISIPLDENGAMLLDWPSTSYKDSYEHISFSIISRLDEFETNIEEYITSLSLSQIWYLPYTDDSLINALHLIREIEDDIHQANEYLNDALKNNSDEDFEISLYHRERVHLHTENLIRAGLPEKINNAALKISEQEPELASALMKDAGYIIANLNSLEYYNSKITQIRAILQEGLKGKFCIIGRVDTGTTDIGVNPFYGEYVNVGTHGVVLDTILSRSFIKPLNVWWSMLLTVLLVPFFMFFINRFKPGVRIAIGFGGAVLVLIVSILLFVFADIFLGPLGPALALVLAVILRESFAFIGSENEKRFIRKAFSTYLSDDVVQEIIADPSKLQLGGAKKHMSAIFTDIKGFSGISERLDPEDLVTLLNKYLSGMSDVVLAEKGTIDKYEGDAIIAFFGAPNDLPDHAFRACKAAIQMKKLEQELNRMFIAEKLSPAPLMTRIGVNTGHMVVGNMGTEKKMNYTIMGNAVNLAARLEGVNKQYGTWIMASEEAVHEAANEIITRKLDQVRVVGINEPVRLYELIDLKENLTDELKLLLEAFQAGLDLFEMKEWAPAKNAFENILKNYPDDGPSRLYMERCSHFIKELPSKSWDGVFNLSQK